MNKSQSDALRNKGLIIKQAFQLQEDENNELNESNQIINEMIKSYGLQNKSYKQLQSEQKMTQEENIIQLEQLSEIEMRKWMVMHGKNHLIDFDEKHRAKLKNYFRALDSDQSGQIGFLELQEPLISMGIADSRESVKQIVQSVDPDGNIEFQEFLAIIKGKQNKGDSSNNTSANQIVTFFQDMINGQLGNGKKQIESKNLPFNLIISTIRRQQLLDSLMPIDTNQNMSEAERMALIERKEQGEKVRKGYEKLISLRKDVPLDRLKSGNSLKSSLSRKSKSSSKLNTKIQQN